MGIATPTVAGNPGDVVYNATPSEGGTLGWTYTTDNAWYAFGAISIDEGSKRMTFDRVGVGTTTVSDAVFKVQANTTSLIVDEIGIGIGAQHLLVQHFKLVVLLLQLHSQVMVLDGQDFKMTANLVVQQV